MSALGLRLLIVLVLAAAIGFGLRRIWRDWKEQFRRLDAAARERDLSERARPDVITLRRSDDGVFRPGEPEGK
ncbi:MAG TPA: hypothetical protein GYA10_00055 [Alphaproteobacteria bacterium]|nr:hypothetical protein [Alphaproteobacteria bacterium]